MEFPFSKVFGNPNCVVMSLIAESPLGGWKPVAIIAQAFAPWGPTGPVPMPKPGTIRMLLLNLAGWQPWSCFSEERSLKEWAQGRRQEHQRGEDAVPCPGT